MNNPRLYNQNLDYLRAVAAIIVFLSHLFQIFWLPVVSNGALMASAVHFLSESAVLVFFVLSGYVISMSLMNNVKSNNNSFSLLSYLISRSARIYPPFLLAILLSIICYEIILSFELPGYSKAHTLIAFNDTFQTRDHIHISFIDFIYAILLQGGMLQINGPLWSLYIEVKMYIFSAMIVLMVFGKKLHLKVIGLLISCFFLYNFFTELQTVYYPLWWLLGGAFYFSNNMKKKNILFVFLIGLLLFSAGEDKAFITMSQIFVIGLIFFSALKWNTRKHIFLFEAASYSYSLYLFHFPIFLLAYSVFSSFYLDSEPSLCIRAISSIIAAISAYCFTLYFSGYVENVSIYKRMIRSFLKLAQSN